METPLAAPDLVHGLEQVSLAAVGCNDLMRCLGAAARDRRVPDRVVDRHAPVLLRVMRQPAASAGRRVGDTGSCRPAPLLLGVVLPVLVGIGCRASTGDLSLIGGPVRSVQFLCMLQGGSGEAGARRVRNKPGRTPLLVTMKRRTDFGPGGGLCWQQAGGWGISRRG